MKKTNAILGLEHIQKARSALLEESTENNNEILAVMYLLTECVNIMEEWLARATDG